MFQVNDLIKIMIEDKPPRHCKIKEAELLVSKLPTRVAQITKDERGSITRVTETCSICMDYLGVGSSSTAVDKELKCSHVFHDRCLAEWLAREPTCPLCRKPVSV